MKKQTSILRKIIFLCSIFFSLFSANAQQVNVATGGNASGTGGSSSYSVGQVAYTNATGTNGSVNQGVQQPFEIFTLGNDNFPEIILSMSVYPNPTTAFVNLNIQNYAFENLNYQLFDLNGRQIQKQKINATETQIQMQNLASAIYMLEVFDNNILLKTFKIIKNN
jgi:hypothetical protein